MVVYIGSFSSLVPYKLGAGVCFNFSGPIISARVKEHGEDTLIWRLSRKKDFPVSRFYKALIPRVAVEFPRKAIWKPKARQGLPSFFGQQAWEKF
jgi:hypothetical protein